MHRKLRLAIRILRYIIPIVRFNFHYLPWRQAIKLPIILYKPKFRVLKGTVKINTEHIRTGMIKLGYPWTCMHQQMGLYWLNQGGVIFSHKTSIANDSIIEIAEGATLEFGKNVHINSGFRISANQSIKFEHNVLLGWGVSIMDSDFHLLTDVSTNQKYETCHRPIVIGHDSWIGFNTTILKGTQIGAYNVIGSSSVVAKDFSNEHYSVIAGNPAKVIKTGCYLKQD